MQIREYLREYRMPRLRLCAATGRTPEIVASHPPGSPSQTGISLQSSVLLWGQAKRVEQSRSSVNAVDIAAASKWPREET